MSKSGIVNVSMVITEEKILSNIDKVQKLINPNSKKQIVELEENSYFKDLVESIKSYLIEYPKKKNFPLNIYKATYGLVEFATVQFEDNTKKIEELIRQRETNISLAGELKEAIQAVDNKEEGWEEIIEKISGKVDEEVTDALRQVALSEEKTDETYTSAMKMLKARVSNLEGNLHIEIDMERLEDSSRALSYIGIEVADALKLIPTPEEQLEAVATENAIEEAKAKSVQKAKTVKKEKTTVNTIAEEIEPTESIIVEEPTVSNDEVIEQKKQYIKDTTFETKPSLWQRLKNSKLVRAATFIFKIKVRIELPSNALPEGRGE